MMDSRQTEKKHKKAKDVWMNDMTMAHKHRNQSNKILQTTRAKQIKILNESHKHICI